MTHSPVIKSNHITKMKKYIINSFLLFMPFIFFSQTTFKGMIMDKNNPKDNLGVEGASVHWLNTNVSGNYSADV